MPGKYEVVDKELNHEMGPYYLCHVTYFQELLMTRSPTHEPRSERPDVMEALFFL
ncbi:hypothetical protein CY34DRAFT_806761 [Suillus luteus UH-Slu-Lm8-n1]|uniref:Uncharacterized protein n=1 Tax=Suillus luteus UH-Slu-Lm8-n1 TaxID=930992 RepID=A0A0D0B348_9AGAM|nr:hypothetical protein CY34DRAFT_806761 [Suillus luteus UH-Slu-Lm8-n1]